MFRQTSLRCGLLVFILALGLALAPAAAPAQGRNLQARRQVRVEGRQPEPSLMSALWAMLASLWGKDGAHLDPYG